ncbi:MAG: NAD(P)(+) transhydrogenase (Re/Si-specific) subunit beta [Puniceicoccales bacterium]|jgi:NAD(P) transhydrogenase subunit beta|nr:NAD(P)(+) transhydrogenase (Re/Si-specific) subunit beta [Puniceicoccales bacterium]
MQSLANIAYLIASIAFIFGIKMLGKATTARRGNIISGAGMLIALCATLADGCVLSIKIAAVAILIGTIVGVALAYGVKMIQLPEMVALLNGLGGAASALVSLAEFHKISTWGWAEYFASSGLECGKATIYGVNFSTFAAAFIGAVTFSGSVVAYLKLSESVKFSTSAGKSLTAGSLLAITCLGLFFTFRKNSSAYELYATVAIALLLGTTGVMRIGGGDMPVVISLLNSLSGMAAAATGLVLVNVVLVVAGCLVGTSGLILTIIMCKSMNRSLVNVIGGGFGTAVGSAQSGTEKPKAISVDDAYYALEAAKNVAFIPGYGMAVAQAQHAVRELGEILERNGTEVRYAIHPVAGRMPGHMNVLLAEADVPYEQLVDMETANGAMASIDVAVIIGANDVVNPAALHDKNSPIYGMPIVNAHLAKVTFVLKRGSGTGFSGLENALFTMPHTRMVYGDAKKTITALVACFKGR